MDFDSISLLTVIGVAVLTAITLQMIVKPAIALKSDENDVLPRWSGIALNVSAIVFGIIWAAVGMLIESLLWDAPTIGSAVVRGFLGGFIAVFGYEGWKNIRKFQQGNE